MKIQHRVEYLYREGSIRMNKGGNENRSVRNTKRRLREGLLSLLQERQLSEISVRELAELADVNRGTFYFHYNDLHDMLQQLEDEFFQGFYAVLNSREPTAPDRSSACSYLQSVFTFLAENQDFCRVLLGPRGDIRFVNRLKALVGEKCSSFWQMAIPQGDPQRYGLFNAFIINGCVGLVETWLNGGLVQSPGELADLAAKVIVSSTSAYLPVSR